MSGRGPAKYWGRENFVAAIRSVQARDPRFSVTVCGAPEYLGEIDAIATETGADEVRPVRSFHEFAGVINAFDLLLTPDTSVVHLAAAWRIPLVGLYRADPRTTPWVPTVPRTGPSCTTAPWPGSRSRRRCVPWTA